MNAIEPRRIYDADNADLRMLKEECRSSSASSQALAARASLSWPWARPAAIPMAQAGHRVVGVELRRDLLAIGPRKRDAVGLSDRNLRLEYGDVRKLDLGRASTGSASSSIPSSPPDAQRAGRGPASRVAAPQAARPVLDRHLSNRICASSYAENLGIDPHVFSFPPMAARS